MNEQLQKQLLEILTSLKDGSPEAWKFLVEQRSLYYFGSAITHMLIGALLLICGASLLRNVIKKCDNIPNYMETHVDNAMARLIPGALAILFGACLIVSNVNPLMVGIAPLGVVLDIIH